jgi:N-acetylmuramoyl-L-alanine amidase
VRSFQSRRSLPVDGLVGPDTWAQLIEAGLRLGDRTLYLHAPQYRGDDVRLLQRKLNALGFDAGREDGVFGPGTDRAVREFQRNVGDEEDGVVGLHTIATLERMRPLEHAPSRALVREEEELLRMQTSIAGQLIAIDPGEAGDPTTARLRTPLARALAQELEALGAKPELLTDGDEEPSPTERAARANERGAAMCLSLDLDRDRDAPGCAYFGSTQTHSPAGKRLAVSLVRELEREVGGRWRLHGLTIAMLRETRMPAVLLQPPGWDDAGDPAFATRLALAVANGIRGFYRA